MVGVFVGQKIGSDILKSIKNNMKLKKFNFKKYLQKELK
jgi:hypothetical protein